jgi:drug/metabolite transporter (DMT)-like permease
MSASAPSARQGGHKNAVWRTNGSQINRVKKAWHRGDGFLVALSRGRRDMGRMTDMQQQPAANLPAPLRYGLAALILGNLFMAFGPMLVRMADTGPVAAAFWRVALAAPLLLVIAARMGEPVRRAPKGLMILFAVSGALFAADLASWHLGILQTKLANANLLGNSTSFLLPLWVFIAARQWPTRLQGIALALAAIGAGLLMGRSYELSPENLVGDLLCLVAGAFYTAYLLLMSRARTTMGPWPVLAWSTIMSPFPLLLIALGLGEQIWPTNWTPLLLLSLGSQILGQALMIYVIGRVSALLFGLTLLLQPMVGIVIGMFNFGEWPAALDWVGMAIIATALILVSQKSDQPTRKSDNSSQP